MSEQIENKLWKDRSAAERRDYLRETATDCIFVVGWKKFPSHQCILSEVSPVFERMFNGDFKEAKSSDEIPLADSDPVAFGKFLHYIYFDEISVVIKDAPLDTLIGLYNIANKYLVDKLMDKCVIDVQHVSCCKSDYDWLSLFEFAHLIEKDTPDSKHKDGLISYVKGGVRTRLQQEDQCITQCTNFYDWESSIFLSFTQTLSPYVRQPVLFQMIEIYAKLNVLFRFEDVGINIAATSTTIPQALDMMLSCVDFTRMTLNEFRNGPAKSKFLNSSEKFDLMAQASNDRLTPENVVNLKRRLRCTLELENEKRLTSAESLGREQVQFFHRKTRATLPF